MAGIDKDVERIFLSLSPPLLELIFICYGKEHGSSALGYARATYAKWKSGSVRMSGVVAERILNLVPLILDKATRFDLVKKLRAAHMHQEDRHVTCAPSDWRSQVAPLVADLIAVSQRFQLPQHVLARVRWVADGDSATAQELLAAAEQDEALVRLQYLEAEFRRIDDLIKTIAGTKSVNHRIELPQGTIHVSITIPNTGFWGWINNLLS